MTIASRPFRPVGEPPATYREAADFLGVSEKTVYNMVKRGELIAMKGLRLVRFDRDDLRALRDRMKAGAA